MPNVQETARELAKEYGWANITRKMIAERAGLSIHQVRTAIGDSIGQLRDALRDEGLPEGEPGAVRCKRGGVKRPAARRAAIIDAAYTLAAERGSLDFLRRDVAERAKVSTGSISQRVGDMDALRKLVLAEAIHRENLTLVALGLAGPFREFMLRNAPLSLRVRAAGKLAQK